MTHAQHRMGSIESLERDFVLLAIPAKANRETAGPALARVAEIVLAESPSNIGSSALRMNRAIGMDEDEFVQRIAGSDGLQCALSSKDSLRAVLRRLSEADLGVSITVSGLIDEVWEIAGELGLSPHSVDLSFGLLGDASGLPEDDVLDIVTMCGHDRVAKSLVVREMNAVAAGAKSAEEAALDLGKPCTCGIFNLARCEALLRHQE